MATQSELISEWKDCQKVLQEIRRFGITKFKKGPYYWSATRIDFKKDFPDNTRPITSDYLCALIKAVRAYRETQQRKDDWDNAVLARAREIKTDVQELLRQIEHSYRGGRPKIIKVNSAMSLVRTTSGDFHCDATWRRFYKENKIKSGYRIVMSFLEKMPHEDYEVWRIAYLERERLSYVRHIGYLASLNKWHTMGRTQGGAVGALTREMKAEVSRALIGTH